MTSITTANGYAIEVLQSEMRHERELRERLEKEIRATIATNIAASEKALNLSSAEIERRLDNLNGEQGRIATVLAQSVPREVWEQSEKARDAWQKAIERDIAELRIARGVKEGEGAGAAAQRAQMDQANRKLVGYAFVGIAILQVILKFWGG